MSSEEQTVEQAVLAAALADLPADQAWLAASLSAVLDESWQPDSQHTLGLPGSAEFRACDIDTGATVPIVGLHILYAVDGEAAGGDERRDDLPGVVHADRIDAMAPRGLCLHNAANGSRAWFWTPVPG